MSVKWEKEEGTNNGKLTFEIEPAKIKEGLDTAFNRVKKTLNVPGFRKGKVPRQIFNKMFGEESLYQDALNAVLPEAYANAVAESNIKPVAQPEIDVESMEKDSTWVLTAKVTVEPEVKLGQYKDLEVKARSTEVSPYIHDVLTNHTDQTITETQYGMLAFDADGTPLELYWNFLDSSAEQSFENLVRSKENILPGRTEEYRGGWSLYDGEANQAAYALVCLKQVVFEDGTVWDNPDYESWLSTYAGKETDAEELEAYYPHEYKRL